MKVRDFLLGLRKDYGRTFDFYVKGMKENDYTVDSSEKTLLDNALVIDEGQEDILTSMSSSTAKAVKVNYASEFIPCFDYDNGKTDYPIFYVVETLLKLPLFNKSLNRSIYIFKTGNGFHVYIDAVLENKYLEKWVQIIKPFADPQWVKNYENGNAFMRFTAKNSSNPEPELLMKISKG